MIPWVLLDTAPVPGGRSTLRLMQRGGEFSIKLDDNELMNSRLSGSEEALAKLTCEPLAGRAGARILIGGLGMGFTLRAALAVLGPDAQVDVAELIPSVITWAKGPMTEVFGKCMSDARVAVQEADVRLVIGAGGARYDAILLDVDNGPDGLTRQANDALYAPCGLLAAYAALRPGGVLAVWSSGPDASFTKRLRTAGFVVEEKLVRASRNRRGARHVIWLATKPSRGK